MTVKNLKEWHKIVCSLENYQCRVCQKDFNQPVYFDGGLNQYVTGHHIQSQKAHPELVLETDNGVCLCKECHGKVHGGLVGIPKKKKT